MKSIEEPVILAVVGVYLALMIAVGWAFKRYNRDTSDFFRGGQRGTWWMVGTSLFISNISAWTFTGGGGQAYEWGWSILWNYWPVAMGLLLCALLFGRWFRQIRATTGPEAIGLRFDELTRQLMAWKNVLAMPLVSGLHLYGLAIFASAVFGIDLGLVIVALGVVVTAYSTAGGRFAVLGADFIQTAIIMPMAALVAILCLYQFGGVGGFLEAIDRAGLTERFQFIKDGDLPANGTYGHQWIAAAVLFFMLLNNLNVAVSSRFFSVKDSRGASWAAWLAMGLMLVGSLLWFVPPITARLLYSDIVATMPVRNPGEAAYAVAALQLLPGGLVGILLVAIFSATMSSMDSSLNGNSGVVVRDIWPAIARWTGQRLPTDRTQLLVSRLVTLSFGGLVIVVALAYSRLSDVTLFDLMMHVLALTGLPFQVPLFWGLFVRKVPRWAAVFAAMAGFLPAIVMFFDQALLGRTVPWQDRILLQFAVGTVAFFATRLWWPRVGAADRAHIDAFFERMHTPVDFEREVGEPTDRPQQRIVGWFSTAVGVLVLLLALVPGAPADRGIVVALAAVYLVFGLVLARAGRPRPAPAG